MPRIVARVAVVLEWRLSQIDVVIVPQQAEAELVDISPMSCNPVYPVFYLCLGTAIVKDESAILANLLSLIGGGHLPVGVENIADNGSERSTVNHDS